MARARGFGALELVDLEQEAKRQWRSSTMPAAGVVAGSFLFRGISHLLASNGNQAGTMSGLAGDISSADYGATAIDHAADRLPDNSGVMDSRSLDNLIADDSSDYV